MGEKFFKDFTNFTDWKKLERKLWQNNQIGATIAYNRQRSKMKICCLRNYTTNINMRNPPW